MLFQRFEFIKDTIRSFKLLLIILPFVEIPDSYGNHIQCLAQIEFKNYYFVSLVADRIFFCSFLGIFFIQIHFFEYFSPLF